jgi:hypothetical protein
MEMTCRKARSLTALMAGGDFVGRKADRLKKHLGRCAECRREYEDIRVALESIKSIAREEAPPEWRETEWKEMLGRVISQEATRRKAALSSPRRHPVPGWGYAGAFLAVVAIVVIGFVLKNERGKSVNVPVTQKEPIVIAGVEPSQAGQKQEKTATVRGPEIPKPAIESARPQIQSIKASPKITRAEKAESGETMTMALVSQDTGLTVYWVFNKNFEWKEDKK